MLQIQKVSLYSVILISFFASAAQSADFIRKESLNLLFKLCDRLVFDQVTAPADSHFGAIRNPDSKVLSAASDEALFPLAVAFKFSNQKIYGTAALRSANRNLRQYLKSGFKSGNVNAPACFQLLSSALAYPILERHFPPEIQGAWKKLFAEAAQVLIQDLEAESPRTSTELALIAASLAALHQIQPDHHWRAAAEKATFNVISRMTPEGFIAETGFLAAETTAIAPGTTFEITLPALAMFSSLLPQERLSSHFIRALSEYLYLVYPDGMLNTGWGAGAAQTSPVGQFDGWGSQAAFALFSKTDSRFYAAATRNLTYVSRNIFSETMSVTHLPHIRRAFGLALTLFLPATYPSETKVLPADIVGWFRHFKSQNLVVIRTANYMATVSGYAFAENELRSGGGNLAALWCKEAGLLQIASPNYNAVPANHPGESVGRLAFGARIEGFQNEERFSNLHDLDCRLKSRQTGWQNFQVRVAGELKSEVQNPSGVRYLLDYTFSVNGIQKDLRLNYSGKKTEVEIVEPFLVNTGTEVIQNNLQSVVIKNPKGAWRLQIEGGSGEFKIDDRRKDAGPLPEPQVASIVIKLPKGKKGDRQRLIYRLEKISLPEQQLADFRIE